MYLFNWFGSVTVFILMVNGQVNITEPGRQTHLYGQHFMVVIPLTTGVPEEGSSIQIACVSCESSSATGSITLLRGNFSETFTVHALSPTFVPLNVSELEPLSTTSTPAPAVFNLTADKSITVTILVKNAGTLNAYTAIPIESLDRYYIVASHGTPQDCDVSELTVVATKPETYFNLQPYINVTILGENKGLPVTTSFEKGIGGWVTYRANESFVGGHLRSDKPVQAIVGTHRRSTSTEYGGAQSLDRMYPLVSLGTRYTAVPVGKSTSQTSPDYLKDVFRVVPIWGDLNITTWSSGQSSSRTYLDSGHVLDLPHLNKIMQIEGSKPFLLLHYTEFGIPVVDSAVVTVPPAEQYTRQSFTFSTFDKLNMDVDTYITVMAPCKYCEQIVLKSMPAANSGSALEFEKTSGNDGELDYCGANKPLDAGVYTIGPQPDSPPEALYSAILYGKTTSGLFAYILASELGQVTCSVTHSDVTLCHPRVPIQPDLTTVQTTTVQTTTVQTTTGDFVTPSPRSSGNGTVIGAVIAVVSIFVGVIILIICCLVRYKSHRWKRLDESEYLEDNPLRMQTINNAVSDGL